MTIKTQTTGDQKTSRVWINKYAQYNLSKGVQMWLKYLATNCYWKEPGKGYKIRRDFSVSHNTIAKNIACAPVYVSVVIAESDRLGFSSTIKSTAGKQDAYALHIDKAKDLESYRPSKEIKRERDKARRKSRSEWKRSHPASSFEALVRTPMTLERLRNGNQKPSRFLLNSKVECAKASYAAVTALMQRNSTGRANEQGWPVGTNDNAVSKEVQRPDSSL
jgi:hypothetical protein